MTRTFLDIGAHLGETLAVAGDPRWGFEEIHAFEPGSACWPSLDSIADERVKIHRFGLWSEDASLVLHDPGAIGASLFGAKSLTEEVETVELRDASTWFREHLAPSDEVVAKINCEGAEVEILRSLLDSGEIRKIDELVVHFDVRKVPGMESEEADVRSRLEDAGVPYHAAEQILFGRNVTEKTHNWLEWYFSGRLGRFRHEVIRRNEFRFRVRLYDLRHR
jgi:FkbM family methyltransferase